MAKKTEGTIPNISGIKVNRIEQVLNLSNYQAEVKKPTEYMGRPILIFGYEIRPGEKGDFAHIDCVDVMTETPVTISTGGTLVMRALEDLQRANAFPVLTTFGMSGNAYVFKDTTVGRNTDLAGIAMRYLAGDYSEQPYEGEDNT